MSQPLDAVRVMALVGDALEHVRLGRDFASAAAMLVQKRRPSRRELAAARRENLEVHGGGPDLSRYELNRCQVLRLRNAIDEVLAAAEVLTAPPDSPC